MSYTLVLKELLKKDNPDLSMLAEQQRENFEKAAEELFEREYYYEAARAFALLKSKEKLLELGKLCLSKKDLAVAYFAFKEAADPEGLNATGEEFLKEPNVGGGLACFEAAGNQEMVAFIRSNF